MIKSNLCINCYIIKGSKWKNYITQFTATLALFILCALPLTSWAQDGSLDLTFDTDGIPDICSVYDTAWGIE